MIGVSSQVSKQILRKIKVTWIGIDNKLAPYLVLQVFISEVKENALNRYVGKMLDKIVVKVRM